MNNPNTITFDWTLAERLAEQSFLFTSHRIDLVAQAGHGKDTVGLTITQAKQLWSPEFQIIGIKTGVEILPGRYTLVVDADTQESFEWLQENYQETFGKTLLWRGSKGGHFVFTTDQIVVSSGIDVSDKEKQRLIDVLGIGKTAVMPPSLHRKTGNPYQILRDTNPIFVPWKELKGALLTFCQVHGYWWRAEMEPKCERAPSRDFEAEKIKQSVTLFDLEPRLRIGLQSCPLPGHRNGDAHPSLSVSQNGKLFNCFSQHGGGDIFTWFELQQGVDFNTAKKKLAEKTGLEKDSTIKEQNEEREGKNPLRMIPTETVFFLDQFSAAFIRIHRCGHYENWPVNSREFRRIATNWLLDSNETPSREKIGTLRDIAEAMAYRNGLVYSLYNRVAKDQNGTIWLDLADSKWRAVCITTNEWKIVNDPPILFRRYTHMKPISIAQGTKEHLDKFLGTINLENKKEALLLSVFLAVAIIPGIPHPIPTPTGPQGAAKTSFCEAIRRIIDPSETLTLSLPRNKDELTQQLMHHYAPAYDNVSELSQWQSDALCRAITGEGFSKRELYSDDGDVIYQFRRVVMLNGINTPGTKPDILDRSLLFSLERIPPTKRRKKQEIDNFQEMLAPYVLWYIFDSIVRALKLLQDVPDKNLPRMADFAWYGEAISRAMGHPENAFLQVYNENIASQHEEAIANTILGDIVLRFIEKHQKKWSGTPTELYSDLEAFARNEKINIQDKTWPKAANSLSRKLNDLKSTLAALGVIFERDKKDKRIITLYSDKTAQNAQPSNSDIENLERYL